MLLSLALLALLATLATGGWWAAGALTLRTPVQRVVQISPTSAGALWSSAPREPRRANFAAPATATGRPILDLPEVRPAVPALRSQSYPSTLPFALLVGIVVVGTLAAMSRFAKPAPGRWMMSAADAEDSYGEEEGQSARRNLIEEIESPWRKIRYFLYVGLGSAACLSMVVELPALIAGLGGINRDRLPTILTDLAVNLGVLGGIALLYNRDRKDQLKKLERIKVGGSISALQIQFSDDPERVKLADLRRGRGRASRVVIVAAPKALLEQCLTSALDLSDRLKACDLLIVPVPLPYGTALGLDPSLITGPHVALPVGGNWEGVMGVESDRAGEQGLDVMSQGFTLVIKKNGRVGQRLAGLPPLTKMAQEVEKRVAANMDVDNI